MNVLWCPASFGYCCWFFVVGSGGCAGPSVHTVPLKKTQAQRETLLQTAPAFFVVCSFTPQQTHYSPLMNTRCLLTDWQSATPHGIIEPLSTAYLSSRRLQPHMCHGSEPVVTACSYFPQLLTIALYLKDSIWSKLDSFILLCFGRAGYLTPLGGALLNIHWREGETAHARTDAVLHAYSWMDRDVFSNSCRRMYIFDSAQVCH